MLFGCSTAHLLFVKKESVSATLSASLVLQMYFEIVELYVDKIIFNIFWRFADRASQYIYLSN